MNIQHIMLDLETLGLRPGSSILQIGAKAFTQNHTGIYMGGDFLMNINIADSMSEGFVTDKETYAWWGEQGAEARELFDFCSTPVADETCGTFIGGASSVSVRHALKMFSRFVAENGGRDTKIWANSPAFDCVLLRAAYEKIGEKEPWDYRNERCVRTIVGVAPIPKDNWPNFVGVRHNALDDAKNQINKVALAISAINRAGK